jgi:Zn-dependent peptidase ImmA (M78 family)
VPVEAIAEDLLGLSVGESDSLDVSGMLLPAERQVWLNATEGLPRRRFTLAHEVGHWVCQCLEGRTAPVYCRSDEVGVVEGRALEREANVFGAELLMPEEAVRAAWSQHGELRPEDAVLEVAALFDVSLAAMQWRLFSFGLSGDPRA